MTRYSLTARVSVVLSVRLSLFGSGTHVSEAQVNKQLNDKERVAAALENGHLLQVVNKCLAIRPSAARQGQPMG